MHWLRRLFRKQQSEKQLDVELRFHIERQISDNIAKGMAPQEARRRAQLDFGGLEPIKQATRESRDPCHPWLRTPAVSPPRKIGPPEFP